MGLGDGGNVDVGLGDAVTWDSGTRGHEIAGTRGTGKYGLEDVIKKQNLNFALNF